VSQAKKAGPGNGSAVFKQSRRREIPSYSFVCTWLTITWSAVTSVPASILKETLPTHCSSIEKIPRENEDDEPSHASLGANADQELATALAKLWPHREHESSALKNYFSLASLVGANSIPANSSRTGKFNIASGAPR
jgi:hypothetical protein